MKVETAVAVLLACSPAAECGPRCGAHEEASPPPDPGPSQSVADLGARCYGNPGEATNAPGYDPLPVDFDGDAIVDILSTMQGDLLFQRGRAAGGFEVATRIAGVPSGADFVVAYVDADEAPDVLAVADDELTVYLQGAGGTLVGGGAQHFTIADVETAPITALDRRGDRNAALAVGTFGSVVLFELDETGRFAEHETILQRAEIVDLARVELDATPGAELAIVADGALWFYDPDDGMVYGNLALTQDAPPVAVDIDRDGRDEIAVLEPDAIVVYRVSMDGVEEVQRFMAGAPEELGFDVVFALGHLDADGAIDAVSVSPYAFDELGGDSCEGGGDDILPGRVELLLANGTRAQATQDAWDEESTRILVIDLDGDGWGDILDGPSVMLAQPCER